MRPAKSLLGRDPDRLLPSDPDQRVVARRLYDEVAGLPLVCPHGHVDPSVLADDRAFPDPASLLVTPDHYVTRLLHADGVGFEELGVGQGPLPETAAREVWRRLCERWEVFAGTPVRFWLEAELADIFGVSLRPSAETADTIFDQVPIRVVPVLRAERAAGRLPTAATRIVAAWLCHLRGLGVPVRDVRADELVPLAGAPLTDAARQVLDALDPELGADTPVVTAVAEQCRQLVGSLT